MTRWVQASLESKRVVIWKGEILSWFLVILLVTCESLRDVPISRAILSINLGVDLPKKNGFKEKVQMDEKKIALILIKQMPSSITFPDESSNP